MDTTLYEPDITAYTKPEVDITITELSRVTSLTWLQTFIDDMSTTSSSNLSKTLPKTLHEAYVHSDISMLPMYTLPTPDKQNVLQGEVICLELGGSTFRCGLVNFDKGTVELTHLKSWIIEEHEKIINSKFFDDIVERCMTVPSFNKFLSNSDAPMAVTWSFPTDQDGKIVAMGKGWSVRDGYQNLSVSAMIESGFKRYGSPVKVKKVINDSVSTALAGMASGELSMSLILGTGVNICFQLKNTLLNTEIGFFGGLEHPTKYDMLLDDRWLHFDSPWNVNNNDNLFQPFELLTGGRHICELFRLVWEDLTNVDEVLLPELAFGRHQLCGKFFCLFSSVEHTDSYIIAEASKKYGVTLTTSQVICLRKVVTSILQRSGSYVRQAIFSIYEFYTGIAPSRETEISVPYTGSFLQYCSAYQKAIVEGTSIRLRLIEDSSVIGGAVAAIL